MTPAKADSCEVCGGAPKLIDGLSVFGNCWRSDCWKVGYKRARAALAERDAEWAKALEKSHYDPIDGLHMDDPRKGYRCDDCKPLRDLLSEAARSAPQESPKNPTERTE